MTETEVERLAQLALAFIRTHPDTPYDTGNLKLSALQLRKIAPYQYEIYISIDIAPYQEYLNERENVGNTSHRNRHHHWWEKMRVNVSEYLLKIISNGYNDKAVSDELAMFEKILRDQENGGNKT